MGAPFVRSETSDMLIVDGSRADRGSVSVGGGVGLISMSAAKKTTVQKPTFKSLAETN